MSNITNSDGSVFISDILRKMIDDAKNQEKELRDTPGQPIYTYLRWNGGVDSKKINIDGRGGGWSAETSPYKLVCNGSDDITCQETHARYNLNIETAQDAKYTWSRYYLCLFCASKDYHMTYAFTHLFTDFYDQMKTQLQSE
jgi:hypothetical protein